MSISITSPRSRRGEARTKSAIVTTDSVPTERLLTQKEVAAALGVSTRYVRDTAGIPVLYLPGNGPAGRRLPRYRLSAVLAWVAIADNQGVST